MQIGITLIGILTGLFGGEAIGLAIAAWIERVLPALDPYAETIGKSIAVALITFLTLIFGELVPKRLAITAPEKIASVVALPMGWLARAAFPFVWLLSHTTRLVLRLLGLGKDEASTISEEEIRMLVAETRRTACTGDGEAGRGRARREIAVLRRGGGSLATVDFQVNPSLH